MSRITDLRPSNPERSVSNPITEPISTHNLLQVGLVLLFGLVSIVLYALYFVANIVKNYDERHRRLDSTPHPVTSTGAPRRRRVNISDPSPTATSPSPPASTPEDDTLSGSDECSYENVFLPEGYSYTEVRDTREELRDKFSMSTLGLSANN